MKNIGLFGGTFNPIHNGHLYIAHVFAEQCNLDCVIFLPAGHSYHKHTDWIAPEHRLKMVEIAIAHHRQFAVSNCDLIRSGATYSIDTINIFREIYPDKQLYWLMGMDSLMNLNRWKDWQLLVQRTKIAVANRAGNTLNQIPQELRTWCATALAVGDLVLLNAPAKDISSRYIRQQIAHGQNVLNLLPEKVVDYIQQHHLYI